MKLLTLNAHSWLETNQHDKIKAIAKEIINNNYDLIAIQEVNQLIKNAEKKFSLYFENEEKKLLAYYFEAMRFNDNKENEKRKIIVLCA